VHDGFFENTQPRLKPGFREDETSETDEEQTQTEQIRNPGFNLDSIDEQTQTEQLRNSGFNLDSTDEQTQTEQLRNPGFNLGDNGSNIQEQYSQTRQRLLKKARFLVEYKNSFNINVVFSYSSRLEGFNKWYIQLWGESLGKIDVNSTHQGLTPIGIIGPIDQHSFLQLIVQGRRDKTVTVIKVKDFDNDLKIPPVELEGLEDLHYLNNIEFSSLINYQADATIESINTLGDIPCDVITIDGVEERSIASLMYEYELLTSLVGKFMYINAYNQPGVESGKIILKKKLETSKSGRDKDAK